MPLITHYLPELQDEEKLYIQDLIEGMSDDQAHLFAGAYRQQRKDPHTVLLTAIVGLVAIPGLQRFWLGQIGMGFLYLFTWGLVLVGSIDPYIVSITRLCMPDTCPFTISPFFQLCLKHHAVKSDRSTRLLSQSSSSTWPIEYPLCQTKSSYPTDSEPITRLF